MVRFTIWSSHSPQTLLMLYRRTDEMISTAGFVTGKAKSFAVSSVPGFITLSVWDWHRNQRGTGFVLNVRLVPDEWMHCLPRLLSFLFPPLISNFSNNPNTRRREVFCLPSARCWSSPFWGPTLAVAWALQLLQRQSHWILILILRGFLDHSEIFSLLWFFWSEHSRSYKLLPVHTFRKDPKLFSSFLDVVSCCIIESSAVAKLEDQCCLYVPRVRLMLFCIPLKWRGPGSPFMIWERLKEGKAPWSHGKRQWVRNWVRSTLAQWRERVYFICSKAWTLFMKTIMISTLLKCPLVLGTSIWDAFSKCWK